MTPRQQAMQQGQKYYMADKPCKNGHYSLRYTKSGACLECLGVTAAVAEQTPRQQAIANGDKYYQSDKPCANGHTGLRYAKSGGCLECLGIEPWESGPSPRQDAIKRGEMFYITGKPCANGHYAPRYTSTGNCTECAQQVKEARRSQRQQIRQDALARGEKYYNSGRRCEHGHKSIRYAPTDECIACIAPPMTHEQLARYNYLRHAGTIVDLQDARQQFLMCHPSEYIYWRKVIDMLIRKLRA